MANLTRKATMARCSVGVGFCQCIREIAWVFGPLGGAIGSGLQVLGKVVQF